MCRWKRSWARKRGSSETHSEDERMKLEEVDIADWFWMIMNKLREKYYSTSLQFEVPNANWRSSVEVKFVGNEQVASKYWGSRKNVEQIKNRYRRNWSLCRSLRSQEEIQFRYQLERDMQRSDRQEAETWEFHISNAPSREHKCPFNTLSTWRCENGWRRLQHANAHSVQCNQRIRKINGSPCDEEEESIFEGFHEKHNSKTRESRFTTTKNQDSTDQLKD